MSLHTPFQGEYEEAEPLYERAIGINEKALGRDHPAIGHVLSNLADLLRAQVRVNAQNVFLYWYISRPVCDFDILPDASGQCSSL